ncbi:MAG: UbiA family prenyltransferase [Myxococcales bacterium]|nr:UbiA family prenyltransferase [Myxococcales bacterium]
MRSWAAQLRLRHWAHFLALPLAGVEPSRPWWWVDTARGVTIAFAVLAFGYLWNGVADRAMDLDPDKRARPSEIEAHRRAALASAASALGVGAFGPWPAFVATLVSLGSGWAYSTGPRLKSIPVIGSAMNVASFAPLLFVGLSDATLPPGLVTLACCFAALLLQNQLLHEAADASEDQRGALRTTFLQLGPRPVAGLAAIAGAVPSIAVASGDADPRLAFAALLALPFAILFPAALFRRGGEASAMRRARLLHRAAAVVGGAALFVWFRM